MKELSVVIAAGSGRASVQRCVRALAAAGVRERCEVIVASSRLISLPEWVRFVAVPSRTQYPGLRAAGLAVAEAPLAAVLSEEYLVDSDWLEQALRAGEADVTAGLVLPAKAGSLAARAAWMWEYAHLAPPLSGGELARSDAAMIAAGNAVYRRERIDLEIVRNASNEMDYHRRLFDAGLTFTRNAALAAEYHPPPFRQFVRHRSRWSAAWARIRATGMSRLKRWAAAASRAALPFVLLGRLGVRIAAKPRYWLTCVAALPLFAVFGCAQAYGEARAYLKHG